MSAAVAYHIFSEVARCKAGQGQCNRIPTHRTVLRVTNYVTYTISAYGFLLVKPQDVMSGIHGCVLAYCQLYLSLILASNITCLNTKLELYTLVASCSWPLRSHGRMRPFRKRCVVTMLSVQIRKSVSSSRHSTATACPSPNNSPFATVCISPPQPSLSLEDNASPTGVTL